MPANILHNYFARIVKDDLPNDIVELIKANEQAYLVGGQGPDLMFYLRYDEPPLPKLGEMVHYSKRTSEIFAKSGDYVKDNSNKAVFAFLLGQLCHYALDSNIHPYVFHRELDLPKFYTKGAHKYIHVVFESGLDYICLRDMMKVKPHSFKGYKTLDIDDKSRADIAKYYSLVVAPMFDMNLPEDRADYMIRFMRKFMRIIDDRTGIKYLIIRGIEKLSGKPRNITAFMRPRKENVNEDWMNVKRTQFPRYRHEDIKCTDTVDEIILRAKSNAIELVKNFYDYVVNNNQLNEDLYYRNYAGERNNKGDRK